MKVTLKIALVTFVLAMLFVFGYGFQVMSAAPQDQSGQITAYATVVKDNDWRIIITPLLGALLAY